MKIYAYDYTISPDNSPEKFKEIREKLKENGFGDGEFHCDVDGSTIQSYTTSAGEILVFDDYDIGAVYVKSDVNLDKVLESLIWKFDKKGA